MFFGAELAADSVRKFRIKIRLHSVSHSFELEIRFVVQEKKRNDVTSLTQNSHQTAETWISHIEMGQYHGEICADFWSSFRAVSLSEKNVV